MTDEPPKFRILRWKSQSSQRQQVCPGAAQKLENTEPDFPGCGHDDDLQQPVGRRRLPDDLLRGGDHDGTTDGRHQGEKAPCHLAALAGVQSAQRQPPTTAHGHGACRP